MLPSISLKALTVNISYDFIKLFDATAAAVAGKREFAAGFDFDVKISSATGEITVNIDDASFYIPKQSSTIAHFKIDPSEDAKDDPNAFWQKYRGVIHRHPLGCEAFSKEDQDCLNPYFEMSLVRIPESNIMFGVIHITLGESAVSFPLELTPANFNIEVSPEPITYQGQSYTPHDYSVMIKSLVGTEKRIVNNPLLKNARMAERNKRRSISSRLKSRTSQPDFNFPSTNIIEETIPSWLDFVKYEIEINDDSTVDLTANDLVMPNESIGPSVLQARFGKALSMLQDDINGLIFSEEQYTALTEYQATQTTRPTIKT